MTRVRATLLCALVWASLACGGMMHPDTGEYTTLERLPDRVPRTFSETEFPTAPPLGVKAWLKGEPVDLATEERLVLVEMWATWCGPCIEQFPHMTQLQAENGGRLVIVALSDERLADVKPFVKKRDAEMGFTVAVDDGSTAGPYQSLSGASGIPHAYLVQGGRVLWNGHPAGLDLVLEEALAGRWTPAAAALSMQLPTLHAEYLEHARAGESAEAAEIGKTFLEAPGVDAMSKNDLSWEILTELPDDQRDLPLALALAEAASEGTDHDDWAILDTYALALFEAGRHEEAVSRQRDAVRLCKEAGAGGSCVELEERLERFSKAG